VNPDAAGFGGAPEMRRQSELLKADEHAAGLGDAAGADQHVRRDASGRGHEAQMTLVAADQFAHQRHRLRVENPAADPDGRAVLDAVERFGKTLDLGHHASLPSKWREITMRWI
jgi:hypothetical protein